MKKLFLIILVLNGINFGQVSADLTIENQHVVGTDFFFDLYLTRTGTNDLYLGNADFILTFDAGNFANPILSKEGTITGYCTFVPTDQSGVNTFVTQINYFTNTSVEILNFNQLFINLDGPSPSDIISFDSYVAWINNLPSTHRLGRFKVSGISNPDGEMNLQWVVNGGFPTQVYSLNPDDLIPPIFQDILVIINAINPVNAPLPVELSSFTAKASNDQVQLNWETKTEVNNFGFEVERASSVDFARPGVDKDWVCRG